MKHIQKKGVNFCNDPETTQMKILRRRSPAEWAKLIKALPAKLRPPIARVVWWDFFAARIASERWDHLDEYIITGLHNLSQREIASGLIAVGFPPLKAKRRMGIISLIHYTALRRKAVKDWQKKCEEKLLTLTG